LLVYNLPSVVAKIIDPFRTKYEHPSPSPPQKILVLQTDVDGRIRLPPVCQEEGVKVKDGVHGAY
jgi:hypothetical protein